MKHPSAADQVLDDIRVELRHARAKHPTWPLDALHALAVVNEEVGELNQAALQQVYEPRKNPRGAVRDEALQAAAMLVRFLVSIDDYRFTGCPQLAQFEEAPNAS